MGGAKSPSINYNLHKMVESKDCFRFNIDNGIFCNTIHFILEKLIDELFFSVSGFRGCLTVKSAIKTYFVHDYTNTIISKSFIKFLQNLLVLSISFFQMTLIAKILN